MGYPVLDDRNIRREFFKAYSIAEAGSWASRIGVLLNSDRGTEEYKWLGGAPIMRKWVGGRLEKGIRDEAYTIKNEPYEATLPVFKSDLRRDKTGMLNLRIAEMAGRAVTHWEKLLSDLIIAGEASVCYDGQFFFDTDHVSGDSGTITNDLTATECPSADVTTTTAPTAAELAAIFVEMIQRMYLFKDDRGEPINQNAREFIVMVPATYMSSTLTALSAQYLTNGVSNPVVANGFSITPLINPRLTWTTKLAMFRADSVMKPFIMQSETGIETEVLGAGSDEAFKNARYLFGINANRAVGYGYWQHAALVTLS
jgi:phage major head subunit gpT-like protein